MNLHTPTHSTVSITTSSSKFGYWLIRFSFIHFKQHSSMFSEHLHKYFKYQETKWQNMILIRIIWSKSKCWMSLLSHWDIHSLWSALSCMRIWLTFIANDVGNVHIGLQCGCTVVWWLAPSDGFQCLMCSVYIQNTLYTEHINVWMFTTWKSSWSLLLLWPTLS